MKFLVHQHLGMVEKKKAESYLWHPENSTTDANVDDNSSD
jgi:hypothetical protein